MMVWKNLLGGLAVCLLVLACSSSDGDGGGDSSGDGDGDVTPPGDGDGDGDGDGEPVSTAPARTLSIVFDYRFDDAGFFDAPEDYEPWVSSISFDCALPWFFDTSPEDLSDAEGQTYDFITTAAHEVGHALGLAGGVVPYDAYVDASRNYTGPGGTTETGGPIPLTEDGHLVAEGYTMSVGSASRIPSEMEFGMLSDIGYDVVADY